MFNLMLIILSPAKSLDYKTTPLVEKKTQPRFAKRSNELVKKLKELSPDEIGKLMHISPKLAELNHGRYQNYRTTPTPDNSRQAILAFTGDVYQGNFVRAPIDERNGAGLFDRSSHAKTPHLSGPILSDEHERGPTRGGFADGAHP